MIKEKFIIQTPLFHKCHLDCGFCMERVGKTRDNTIDYDYIKSLPEKAYNIYKDWIYHDKPKDIYLEICGGEIFPVGLPDKVYVLYEYYIEETTKILKDRFSFVENVYVEWDTSLIFINTHKLDYFLDKYGGTINTSYDTIERFPSESARKLWLSLVLKYRERISTIEFVFTKPGIECMMKDPFLDKIPKEIEMNLSMYYPTNDDYWTRMPNDDILYRFLKWGLDEHRFNFKQVEDCIKTIISPDDVVLYCECFEGSEHSKDPNLELNCFTAFKDESYYKEDSYKALSKNESFLYKKEVSESLRGCTYCEYNGRCQKMCCYIIHNRYYILDKECPFKRIYKYIESNKSIIEAYERMCNNG